MATSAESIVSTANAVNKDDEKTEKTTDNIQVTEAPLAESNIALPDTCMIDTDRKMADNDTLIVQPLASSCSEQSQNVESPATSLKTGLEIVANESGVTVCEHQAAVDDLESCEKQIKTLKMSSLENSNQDVSARMVVPVSNEGTLVAELGQEKGVTEDKCAKIEPVNESSDGSQKQLPGKHELTSAISLEDNVFEDAVKTQVDLATGITSSQEKPTLVQTVSDFDSRKQGKELPEERPVREMLVRRSRTESTESITDKPVLETLTFGMSKNGEAIKEEMTKTPEVCVCLLCDRSYSADNKEDVLAHLVLMHKFVIADVSFIGNLPEYMRYWKKRFQEKPFSEFCSKIVTNAGVKDDALKEEFFLLCDALPEDKEIRESLQRKKLESVLAQQQKEREETRFCRQCLFCSQTFCGNRSVLIDHLVRDHTFHVGKPDNLVFTDEMFDLIQSKIDHQMCLFCEKSFKDKASLKEHMRKKQHRKINPKHKEYDRFYVINYMEMGKNWKNVHLGDSRLVSTSSDVYSSEEDEWSGWNAESESRVVCLFCDVSCVTMTELQDHMKEKHNFDLHEVNTKLQLKFYQKVKLINYIRRQVYHKTCYGCQQVFDNKDELLSHLDQFSEHILNLPGSEVWDQTEYFFPTYEDDTLLCNLDDDNDDSDSTAAGDDLGELVIKEDITLPEDIMKDKNLQDLFKA